MKKQQIIRCAIYTRKSTEEGLDMDYNTLDAQREAGEKYIEAMKHEGWRVLPELYNDGGYSGGNMERPSLKKLINDIEAGLIDIVVVYKVDRLTRSLTDFAKLVEIFDKNQTSFVSVTQHFNTQDSMGRLTLNILLSFAQFEREITGERIRDKFAASKKKGMWMGGPPILGYDIIERKLIVNPHEAKQVEYIFKKYIEYGGSISLLSSDLHKNGYRTKSYISGNGIPHGKKIFTSSSMKTILKNRLYLGEVHCKGEYYQGEHKAIISREIFDEAQEILSEKAQTKQKRTHAIKSKALLKGIIVCGGCGGAMSPTSTKKKNKIYRYYITNSHRRQTCHNCPVKRIPAGEIEDIIKSHLQAIFASPEIIVDVWRKTKNLNLNISEQEIHECLKTVGSFWNLLFPAEQKRITRLLIERVVVKSEGIDIEYNSKGIEKIIRQIQSTIAERSE